MASFYINDLPVEILETIFLALPSVVDQINLSLVCRHWHQIVLAMRHFHRKHLTRKKVRHETRVGKAQRYTFDRHVYIRLPVAGSLNDWGK